VSDRCTLGVIGLWHLGSTIAASWAELGYHVIGLDTNPEVIAGLRNGHAPLFEPGLDDMLAANLAGGRLSFTTTLKDVGACDVVFLACDTPVGADDTPDLSSLDATIRMLPTNLASWALVVVSSQVPVGTCGAWRSFLQGAGRRPDVEVAYSPENVRLGEAIKTYMHPDRIILGADDDRTRERAITLFSAIDVPIVAMSLATAEMTKQALNAFLATSVSFINEIADLCEVTGADVRSVSAALRSDARIGPRAFLSPGLGFAGGTLGRDVRSLTATGRGTSIATPMLEAVLEVNRRRVDGAVRRLRAVHGCLDGLVVGVLGLTYKPGTSTLRRSVALDVTRLLADAGAIIRAYDPRADLAEVTEPIRFTSVGDAYAAADGASALLLLTEWPEFARLDFPRIKTLMAKPVILDVRNALTELKLQTLGFRYIGVGW